MGLANFEDDRASRLQTTFPLAGSFRVVLCVKHTAGLMSVLVVVRLGTGAEDPKATTVEFLADEAGDT